MEQKRRIPSDKDFPGRLPPDLLKSLNDLRQHEEKILSKLNGSPKLTERFFTDPGSVLDELKIPIDRKLRQGLRTTLSALNITETFGNLEDPMPLPRAQIESSPSARVSRTRQHRRAAR